eukprot:CAMPEP_0179427580 /NCGR_PEP_ID=MMETSP0799-20121207/13481_1 /TAXON_ID=46947 /ORGANISM="Geminigera cryophila, Strain CCMP2564" /LENGTH=92 /DNA_ID=CAMNT_0021202675 /DNA_START=2003 /DNA_END=2282 /DNA_ORIENTATION=+
MTTASQSNTSSTPPTNAGSSWSAFEPSPSTSHARDPKAHRLQFSITTAVKSPPQATAIARACRAQRRCRATKKRKAASSSFMPPLILQLLLS